MYGLRTLLPLVLLAVPAVGCSALGGEPSGTDDGELNVATSVYPLAFIAERVGAPHADVISLTQPGVEPHDLELTPRQVADISDADVVLYLQGFQPAVDEAVDQSGQGAVVDATDLFAARAGESSAGSAHEAGSAHDHGSGLADDPHIWLDPTLLVPVAEAYADAVSAADPGHADGYRRNADALVADLKALDSDFTTGLQRCARREFVTSHAAFGYLAERYDLTMMSIAGLSPDVEPSPQRLAELQDQLSGSDITTVFSETLGSKEYAETLADDLGLQTAVLDPVEGLPAGSDDDYFSVMRRNLAALQQANDCR